jgi:hypothetical protein
MVHRVKLVMRQPGNHRDSVGLGSQTVERLVRLDGRVMGGWSSMSASYCKLHWRIVSSSWCARREITEIA